MSKAPWKTISDLRHFYKSMTTNHPDDLKVSNRLRDAVDFLNDITTELTHSNAGRWANAATYPLLPGKRYLVKITTTSRRILGYTVATRTEDGKWAARMIPGDTSARMSEDAKGG